MFDRFDGRHSDHCQDDDACDSNDAQASFIYKPADEATEGPGGVANPDQCLVFAA